MNKDEILRELFKEYNLIYDKNDPEAKTNDIYKHKHYLIITRSGIQKIERQAGVKVTLNPVDSACGKDYFTIQAYGERIIKGGEKLIYETFASASSETSRGNAYYPEMAEKRARSRIILTLVGLYEYGVMGQDEADEFNDAVKNQQSYSPPKALYKGDVERTYAPNNV